MRSCRSNCRDDMLTVANTESRRRTARCQPLNSRAVRSNTYMPRSTMRPTSSAMAMNSDGEARPILGRSQRGIGWEAGAGGARGPHDGLEEVLDLPALGRPPQLGFERHAVALARPHRGLKYFDAVAADALGVIHRELGVL